MPDGILKDQRGVHMVVIGSLSSSTIRKKNNLDNII